MIGIDEVGYVAMAEVGAEYLFQVIADRAEKATVLLTTNLPFSEWTKVIPDARLRKALIDRITGLAHIIETSQDSYRSKSSNGGSRVRELPVTTARYRWERQESLGQDPSSHSAKYAHQPKD